VPELKGQGIGLYRELVIPPLAHSLPHNRPQSPCPGRHRFLPQC
jgi:hypothetical protein